MTTVKTSDLRDVLRSFGADKKVCSAVLYELFGLVTAQEKQRLRDALKEMCARGELVRLRNGEYKYNFNFRLRENAAYGKIWRFVRASKPGWTRADIARQLNGVSAKQIDRYCQWLAKKGFIEKYGKQGAATSYRATYRASMTPETPYPCFTDRPFEQEKAAALALARLILCENPSLPKIAGEIVTACDVLYARFKKDTLSDGGQYVQ